MVLVDEDERRVDPYLGYPRAYAKFCRNAYAWMQLQGYALPFSQGPPKKFLPYAPRPEDVAKLEKLQDLFPVTNASESSDSTSLQKFKDVLWQQLDHLGNAGFDPASFRVDAYGNVLYWNADPASPLAWQVCHWFPHSRGGKTVLSNLRIVHWRVEQRKKDRLEFLIPWWELQLGVSVSQFLDAFESAHNGFRQRWLSFMFLDGEEEMPDGKTCVSNHRGTQNFLQKQKQCGGFAPAAIVSAHKDPSEDVLRPLALNPTQTQLNTPGDCKRAKWSQEEDDAVLRGVQKFGFGNWKDIKENERVLANRSLVQIRDKYRSLTGLGKENHSVLNHLSHEDGASTESVPDSSSFILSSLKRECKIKLLKDEEKQLRQDEASKLRGRLDTVKQENEKEKAALDALEADLKKYKKQVEKQRQWNETQAAYRLCLERMIQETMHQSVVFKEEARLNQAACNSLVAQLESQAQTCSAAESMLLKHSKERQSLAYLTHPPQPLESTAAKDNLALVEYKKSKDQTTKEERSVLRPRDVPNLPQDSDSDSQRSFKRFKKSFDITPLKRYHSAPRQRNNKDNGKAPINEPVPSSAKKLLNREIHGLDKVYYEGSSRRTAGHGAGLKPCPNPRTPVISKILENEADKKSDEVSDNEKGCARTFKLMPVLKRDDQKAESGYASCDGNQRLRGKGILHAPRSRESSERFEIDVSAIESRAPAASGVAVSSCSELKLVSDEMTSKKHSEEHLNEQELREGKSTVDKWLQILLNTEQAESEQLATSASPQVEIEPQAQTAKEIQKEPQLTSTRSARGGWPEGVGVPPSGLPRGQSVRVAERRQQQQQQHSKKSDKIKVPFSGLFRKLSMRQHHSSSSRVLEEEAVEEPHRRQVTFEDWEGLSSKLAAMNLESTMKLRSSSVRASTGSLPRSAFTTPEPSPQRHPAKVTKSVLYYSTDDFKPSNSSSKHQSLKSIKAMSRRASINECAEAWKKQVNKV